MSKFTINVYCENKTGLISKLTLIFTRRKISLESLNASETEIPNVYKITIIVNGEKTYLEKVVKQIEKLVEVYKAFLHEKEEIISRQMAMFKIGKTEDNKDKLQEILNIHSAIIALEEDDFYIIEKTGTPQDIEALFESLNKDFNLIEYSPSGIVAIVKWSKKFHQHLINLSIEKEEVYS